MNRQITYKPSRPPLTDFARAAGDPVAMTSPRSHLVDPAATGFYHCRSRTSTGMNRHDPTATPSVLRRLGLREDQWHTQATGIEQRYWRAVGAVDALDEKARTPGIAIVSPVVSLQ